MNPSGNDPDDKVVVDTTELEPPGRPGSRVAKGPGEQPEVVRARGTREQLPVSSGSGASAPPPHGPRDLTRDPIEVLRAWPHSMGSREARTASLRATTTASGPQPRVEDKLTLAHLAIDLYREVEQIHASSRRASEQPETAVCTNRGCDVRINALRGALIEACLLVQRLAMMPAMDRADIEDRIRKLLELLER